MIEVTVGFTGMLRMHAGTDKGTFELAEGARLPDLIQAMCDRHGEQMAKQARLGFQVVIERGDKSLAGEVDAMAETELETGDVIMFLYTFAGG